MPYKYGLFLCLLVLTLVAHAEENPEHNTQIPLDLIELIGELDEEDMQYLDDAITDIENENKPDHNPQESTDVGAKK